MVVNFEFLGGEPIENLITCMNFKIDKVVFFGYREVIENQKVVTEKILRKYCGVKTVVFHTLSHNNLQETLCKMRKEVQHERSLNNLIFFDITGGESLILVAFGMLSKDLETPMHMYDIPNDKLIELDEGALICISKDVDERKVPMSLNLLIEMHGGTINKNLHKDIKSFDNPDFIEDVEKIYQVAKKNWDYWNPFSDLLRRVMVPVDSTKLQVSKSLKTIHSLLSVSNTKLKTVRKLNDIVDSLADEGILLDVSHTGGQYRFEYKNQAVKNCLWESGSILELHTFQRESLQSDECQAGVHIDWDGEIHTRPGSDVLNEIDVLALKGNIPTFISCKTGKMGAQSSLHALYELQTVAGRFGGKYARKVLVTAKGIGDVYKERAAEMGIEVR